MMIVKISNKSVAVVAASFAFVALSQSTLGQRTAAPTPPASLSAQQMTKAAVAFLTALTDEQREAAMYAFTAENRTNWSNVPMFVHARPGVRFADLNDRQRQAAHDLLRASMSSQGYQKIAGIMRLDSVHGTRELEHLEAGRPGRKCAPLLP